MIFIIASSMFMLSSGSTLTSQTLSSSGLITYGTSAHASLLPLHVDGNKIRDSNGGIVYLRGVNRPWYFVSASGGFGKLVNPSLPATENNYNSAVYSQASVDRIFSSMASKGINCVRMYSAAKFWFDNYNIDTDSGVMTYRQTVSDMIGRAANYGIYVIWSTYTYFPSTSGDYYGYGPWLEVSFPPDGLTGNIYLRTQQDFTNYIVSQITALGSHNNLIIEPWNEPAMYPDSPDPNSGTIAWHNSQQAIINAMRAKEDELGQVHHLFLAAFTACLYLGGTSAIYNFNWIDKLPQGMLIDLANNIFYDAHCYRAAYGSVGIYPNCAYTYADVKAAYQTENVEYYSRSYPLFIGEMGPYSGFDQKGYETQWFDNTLRIWNEWGIGYTVMAWWGVGPDPMINEDVPEEVANGGTLSNYGNILAKYL